MPSLPLVYTCPRHQAQVGSEKRIQPCPSGRGLEVPLVFSLSEVWAPSPGCS